MIRTLKKRGNSHALIIERALMDQLGIEPDTKLQLVVSDGTLHVTPMRVGLGSERIGQIADELFARYDETFHELAK
jgi:antitoxin component of MazEF toxin-antitoxin module